MDEKEKNIKEYAKKMYDAIMDAYSFLDGLTIDKNNVADVLEKLMKIYLIGIRLPYLDTVDLIDNEDEWRANYAAKKAKRKPRKTFVKTEYDCYTFTYTPYDDDVLFYHISLDLLEVFENLMDGAAMYEAGYVFSAVGEWGFMMEHWAKHLLNTIRPLEAVRTYQAEELNYELIYRISEGHDKERSLKQEEEKESILGYDADHGRIWIKDEYLEKTKNKMIQDNTTI